VELSEDCKKVIEEFGLKPPGYPTEIPADYFGTGSVGLLGEAADFDLWASRMEGWQYMDEWGNGYRSVWVNRKHQAILTYVEGDVDLTVDLDTERFEARLESASKFYTKQLRFLLTALGVL